MEKELPKGWEEAELKELFALIYGKGLRLSDFTTDGYDVYGANGIIGKYYEFNYEDSKVIISCRGAASGAIHKTRPFSFITSNSIVLDEFDSKNIDLDFVKYAMIIANKEEIISGSAQPQITIQKLQHLPIPLPPLPEQKRIVTKLDTLFASLNNTRARLEKIPQLIKNFRQAVLTQAVTGKLTEEWREGKELEDWEEINLGELLTDVKYGTSKKSSYDFDGIPVLRIPNIKDGEINDEDLKYSLLKDKELEKLSLKKGDILIIRSNGSLSLVGRSAIIRSKHDSWVYAGYLVRLRPKTKITGEYLNFVLQSNFLRGQIVKKARSTNGVNNINSQEIKDLLIPFSPLEEQQEIVRRVESLFAKADAIEQQYESLKQKIDALPQAILAKAFRGELVEQNPLDEPASELLKRIRAEKEKMTTKGQKRNMKRKRNVAAEPQPKYGKK